MNADQMIARRLARVTDDEMRGKYSVIICEYNIQKSMKPVAEKYGLSVARVQQILNKYAPEIVERQGVCKQFRRSLLDMSNVVDNKVVVIDKYVDASLVSTSNKKEKSTKLKRKSS